MEQEFLYNGQIIPVIVEEDKAQAAPKAYRAKVEGVEFSFSAASISPNEFTIYIDGAARRVFAAANGNRVYIHIGGRVIALEAVDVDKKSFAKDSLEFGSKDHVSTPMPGKVVKILVEVGERVEVKQPLVIVESMKMENEIKSPTNGTVKSIHYKAGDLVETGQPIIKIEPES